MPVVRGRACSKPLNEFFTGDGYFDNLHDRVNGGNMQFRFHEAGFQVLDRICNRVLVPERTGRVPYAFQVVFDDRETGRCGFSHDAHGQHCIVVNLAR